MRDIKTDLQIDLVSSADLIDIFSEHFSSANFDSNEVVFSRGPDSPALRVRYTAKEAIVAIEPLAHWQDSDLSELQSKISDHANILGVPVALRRFVFCGVPISRALKVEGWFQLLPVPSDAPSSNFMWGKFPAILEVAHVKSGNHLINMRNSYVEFNEVGLLLNFLFSGGLRIPFKGASEWGVRRGTVPPLSEPFHIAYTWPDAPDGEGQFSDLAGFEAFVEIQPSEYYQRENLVEIEGEPVPTIGSDFQFLVERYRALDPKGREDFQRAAYWLQHSSTVAQISQAASYMALVQAIEALAEKPKDQERCPTCDHLPGAVRHYTEFVDKYASGLPKKLRNEIYSMRSKIAHEGKILRADADIHGIGPIGLRESGQLRLLSLLVRLLIRNWLASHA